MKSILMLVFGAVALAIWVGVASLAVGSLAGMPVVPADAPIIVLDEVVVQSSPSQDTVRAAALQDFSRVACR